MKLEPVQWRGKRVDSMRPETLEDVVAIYETLDEGREYIAPDTGCLLACVELLLAMVSAFAPSPDFRHTETRMK